MDKTNGMLTVFFEEPFWVGVFEITENGKLSAAKMTFGAEPKDGEVFEFILKHYYELKFSPAVETKRTADNPKRRQRQAHKQLSVHGTGTKSQQALKLMQEAMKTERRQITKEQREAEKQRQFEFRQQKRREKHKGH